ncbi:MULTISPECIES: hypothetical protein [Arthrobacter]|uniref:Uncharacterized protein n=1 Tax=Arthrobacter terricola TaxID=2547396 RepID=A0A4R5KDF5_9MICC|nr:MULTISPECIES: hypothetical protein [Arthrobacter]MBT8161781.1 hypothetical protein [Arthrobacter sp. GN70]TDF92655.1 hypothetical protein E1809_17525 [Arthrobacter terricola]
MTSQQTTALPTSVFDVHGRVDLKVAPGTPGEAQLRDMLGPFLGPSASAVQLEVSGTITGVPAQSRAEDAYRYTDDSLFLPEDRVRIVRTERGFAVEGPGELLTAVVPLLDHLCIQQDTAMVHAAIVDFRGSGVLLPAWGGVGKTSTVAKLMAMPGVGFMADDWGFLTGRGDLLSYAKPMFIKPHHRPIYPELFQGVRKPLAPGWLTSTVSNLATAVHPVIVRYPRTAAFTRRWSPEHRMVHPAEVFGADKIAQSAPLRLAIFLERYDDSEARLERRSNAWMASRIVGNFHSELPSVSRRLIEALGATGLVPLSDHFSAKTSVIARGLGEVPCFLLRLPASWSADRTSDHVSATVVSMVEGRA